MNIISIPGFSEPYSSISHLLGAIGFFIASFFLVSKGRGNSGRVTSLVIYSFSLVFLLSMSGVYHLLERGYTPNYVLKILDYAGIYTLIAGTFTPIHAILFRGIHRWLILAIVWTLAIVALTLTAIFFESIPDWLHLTFFLSLGWFGLYSMVKLYQIHSKRLVGYMIAGGLCYTIGAVYEFLGCPVVYPGVIGLHEVFHTFVLLGALFHWRLIYIAASYPVSSQITIVVKIFPNGDHIGEATSEHISFKASSKEELKKEVFSWIESKFHQDMKPKSVSFKYFDEELITFD